MMQTTYQKINIIQLTHTKAISFPYMKCDQQLDDP